MRVEHESLRNLNYQSHHLKPLPSCIFLWVTIAAAATFKPYFLNSKDNLAPLKSLQKAIGLPFPILRILVKQRKLPQELQKFILWAARGSALSTNISLVTGNETNCKFKPQNINTKNLRRFLKKFQISAKTFKNS